MGDQGLIMVVDDERCVTSYVSCILERAGYDVHAVNESRTVLDRIAEKKPNLILLDINMPEMNGYEILRGLRQTSSVPVIMVTALAQISSVALSLNLGADDYIEKPFRPAELLARVKSKLRRSQGNWAAIQAA